MTTFLICWFILAAGHFSASVRTRDRYAAIVPPDSALSLGGTALWCLFFWWVISLYCLRDGYRRFFR